MTQFSDLRLDPRVLQAVTEAGYSAPTPIQEGAIPPAIDGRDVLGIAQTGTGKTASFVLPMITKLASGRARARMPRSLVLCPTRELAAQVAENFDKYAKYVKLTKALLIGGVSMKDQEVALDRGVDVLIATPGRLLDHFERGRLLLTGVQIMVVDEADRMLDMGFIPDIERIFKLTPFTRQTLFFSATMASEIERITSTFLSNPARIEVARQATASETIEQGVVMFRASGKDRAPTEKRELLRALIQGEGEKLTNAILFCNRKTEVDILSKSMQKYGMDAAAIHGDLDQAQRTRTLESFRDGKLKFLVASDVAARGLDIPAVSHVFNFDVPSHPEDYVHRIGRTGRAGRLGKTLMICAPSDEENLAAVESLLGKPVPRVTNPLGETVVSTEAADEKPQREERRSRNRRGAKRDTAPAEPQVTEAAVTAEATVPQERQSERKSHAPAREPRRDDRQQDERKHDRRDQQRGDSQVVGFGDALPDFMTRTFAN